MGKKKKRFIDKKNAHSFQLVHRSQRDPLQADEDSSKRVLLPLDQDKDGKGESSQENSQDLQKNYGIYFDDEYDYMQHLKTRTDTALEPLPDNIFVVESKKAEDKKDLKFGNVSLPSEVFPSEYEEDEGLLNLAAPVSGPQPDLDPDIIAALDDALNLDDPQNILDDDFIIQANADTEEEPHRRSQGGIKGAYNEIFDQYQFSENEDDDDDDYDEDEEDGDDECYPSDGDAASNFSEEETKSKFTSYSMTSSVIRRNEGLTLLDDRFDKIMEDYDEDEIGPLDHEFLSGTIEPNDELLTHVTEEFITQQKKTELSEALKQPDESQDKHPTTQQDDDSSDEADNNNEDKFVRFTEEPKEKWDCESILSTYSTLYNHPTLIKEPSKKEKITLSKKTGIPLGVLPSHKKTKDSDDVEHGVGTNKTNTRARGETAEEKRERKRIVKEERKDRRAEKKANKSVFKYEKKRQEKALLNTQAQQGVKL